MEILKVTDGNKIFKYTPRYNIISLQKQLFDATENAQYYFSKCEFESVDDLIEYSDTENVTDMQNMFDGCTNLQTIPQLDTSKVTDMSYMFSSCTKLQTIDITSLDKISSTNNMSSFAAYCCQLTKLIIRNMTVIPPLNSNSFTDCNHFDGTAHGTYNPDGLKDGRIYVPDNMVDSLKAATNWSAYADIIVPLSSLEE